MKRKFWVINFILIGIGIFFAIEYYLFFTQIKLIEDIAAKMQRGQFSEALNDCEKTADYYILSFPIEVNFYPSTEDIPPLIIPRIPKDVCYAVYLSYKLRGYAERRELTDSEWDNLLADINEMCPKFVSNEMKESCHLLSRGITIQISFERIKRTLSIENPLEIYPKTINIEQLHEGVGAIFWNFKNQTVELDITTTCDNKDIELNYARRIILQANETDNIRISVFINPQASNKNTQCTVTVNDGFSEYKKEFTIAE